MATGQRRALAATLLVVAVTLGHHRGLDTEPEPSEHPIREWSSEEPSQVYCQAKMTRRKILDSVCLRLSNAPKLKDCLNTTCKVLKGHFITTTRMLKGC